MQILPFNQAWSFFKGNMHTHTTHSDGAYPVERVCAAYHEKGYDFLVITDHFMPRFGSRVTDTRPYRRPGFTTIIGAELHAPSTELGETWHIKAIGLPLDFAARGHDETGPAIARRAFDAGAFIGIVHPSWYGLTAADADAIDCAHAVEIYNHGSAVEVDRGNDWPFLDALLNRGRHLSGYASDDAHHLTHDWLGGWVMVNAQANEPECLLNSLKNGWYYSSQGPEIHAIDHNESEVVVHCSPVRSVAIQGRGAASSHQRGTALTEVSLPLERMRDKWFRVTVTDGAGSRAWSNPIWLE